MSERRSFLAHRLSDPSEIDRRTASRYVRRRCLYPSNPRVGSRQAHSRNAGRAQGGNKPRIYKARQNADHNLERRLVGDAQSVDLPLLDACSSERRVDLATASVDDDERAFCG